MHKFKQAGLLSQQQYPDKTRQFNSWSEFTKFAINDHEIESMRQVLNWLGLLDESPHEKIEVSSNFDGFCQILQRKLKYSPGEHDMVFLHHRIVAFDPERKVRRVIDASLCEFGNEEFSAMARTVGLPVAVAALKILNGEMDGVIGVKAPIEARIYQPILEALKQGKYFKFITKEEEQ
jgi:alpha-aminoadipic semialdehyde synthase